MKTKSIILLSVCAIVTLSFTFSSVKKNTASKSKEPAVHSSTSNHRGGFALEDKLI